MGPRFAPGLFNALLAPSGVGQNVLWRRSSLCPCRDVYSGQAEQGCPRCQGRGVTWAQGQPAHAGVVGQKSARQWLEPMQIEQGDQILSVPGASPARDAGENDLFLMIDSSQPFAAVLQRDGAERIDPSVFLIDRCHWLNQAKAEVEAGIPRVDPNTGALTWADPASAPPPGEQFAVRGRRRPTYFVFKDLPQDRAHGGGLPLPRRIHARRFDLFGR
jgi:hypothetical protein